MLGGADPAADGRDLLQKKAQDGALQVYWTNVRAGRLQEIFFEPSHPENKIYCRRNTIGIQRRCVLP